VVGAHERDDLALHVLLDHRDQVLAHGLLEAMSHLKHGRLVSNLGELPLSL
jgi:hypothetical protein